MFFIIFLLVNSSSLNVTQADNSYDSTNRTSLENTLIKIKDSLSSDPKNIDKLQKEGEILFQLQKYDDAMNVFDTLLSIDATNSMALRYKGYIYDMEGNHASAFASFYRAYQVNATDIEALSMMSYDLLKLKTPSYVSLASTFSDKALDIDPENEKALISKGFVLNAGGYYNESITYFQSELKHSPNNVDALLGLAERSYLMGDYADARNKFLEITNDFPSNHDAIMGLGKSTLAMAISNSAGKQELDKNTFDQAIDIFNKLTNLDKNDIDALYYLGDTYYEMAKLNSERTSVFDTKNYHNAIPYLEEYIAEHPTDIDTLLKLGNSYHNVGNYDEAISYYDKILKINPTHGFAKIGKEDSLKKLKESNADGIYQFYDYTWFVGIIAVLVFVAFLIYKLRKILLFQ